MQNNLKDIFFKTLFIVGLPLLVVAGMFAPDFIAAGTAALVCAACFGAYLLDRRVKRQALTIGAAAIAAGVASIMMPAVATGVLLFVAAGASMFAARRANGGAA